MIDRRTLLTAGVALSALIGDKQIWQGGNHNDHNQRGSRFPQAERGGVGRKRLTEEQFDVLRKHGTERAGTSPLNHEKHKGTFACAGCDLPLFSSDTKFESGTGWPSFYQPLPDAVGTTTDRSFFMTPHRGALQPL